MQAPQYIRSGNLVTNLRDTDGNMKILQLPSVNAAKRYVRILPPGSVQTMHFESKSERQRILWKMHKTFNNRGNVV